MLIREACEYAKAQELARSAQLYDIEKQELYQEIRELKIKCEAADKQEETFSVKQFFHKWMFMTKLIRVNIQMEAMKKKM